MTGKRCPSRLLLSSMDAVLLSQWLFILQMRMTRQGSNGATFNFCPSGNIAINVTQNIMGYTVKDCYVP